MFTPIKTRQLQLPIAKTYPVTYTNQTITKFSTLTELLEIDTVKNILSYYTHLQMKIFLPLCSVLR